MTKILIVTRGFFHPWMGGVASYSRGLVDGIGVAKNTRNDLSIEVLSSFDGVLAKPDFVETNQSFSQDPPKLVLYRSKYRGIKIDTLNLVKQIFADGNFDIIHVVSDGLDPLLVKSKTSFNRKTLIAKHLFIYPNNRIFFAERLYYKYLERTGFSKSIGVVICPSCEALKSLYGLQNGPIMPPIVDTELFGPSSPNNLDVLACALDAIRKSKVIIGDFDNALSHEVLLLYLGPLTPGRFNADSVLGSILLLAKEFSVDVGLIAIGRGFEKLQHLAKIKRVVEQNRLDKRVFFCLKTLTDIEKISLFRRASVFLNLFDIEVVRDSVVLPPVVILEGMASGKPVIVGGLPSLDVFIKNNYNGLLVENINDEKVLASKIWSCLTRMKELGDNARLTIERNFSAESFSRIYLNFLASHAY